MPQIPTGCVPQIPLHSSYHPWCGAGGAHGGTDGHEDLRLLCCRASDLEAAFCPGWLYSSPALDLADSGNCGVWKQAGKRLPAEGSGCSIKALMRQCRAGLARTGGWAEESNGPFGLAICETVPFWEILGSGSKSSSAIQQQRAGKNKDFWKGPKKLSEWFVITSPAPSPLALGEV